jgi:phosphatidylinositol alpha-1,6-mannosyltransferase
MGQVTDAELADIYQASDVHVFPVRGLPGDPEGFGMVAIEAAAHGLPTVAFASGGTIDAVAEGRSGRLVESGDYQAFADAVLEVFRARGSLAAGSIDFARRFAWPEFGSRLARELASRLEAQGHVRGATP